MIHRNCLKRDGNQTHVDFHLASKQVLRVSASAYLEAKANLRFDASVASSHIAAAAAKAARA